jgi:hypothetical protein
LKQLRVDPTPVVWVVPRSEFELGEIPEQLAARGYGVLRCLPGASAEALRKEYESDTKPTLIVAGSRAQELPIIEFLSGTGDVAVGPR